MVLNSLEDVHALIDGVIEEDIYGSSEAQLDCLLPTGIYIVLVVNRWATVQQAKQKLWEVALDYPLFDALPKQDLCAFVYINSFGEREEITDENRQISTIQPFLSVLQIIRRKPKTDERNFQSQIGSLIGKHDFDLLDDEEIVDFRKKCKQFCEQINVEKSAVTDLSQQIAFIHPPDFCEHSDTWRQAADLLESTDTCYLEVSHDQANGTAGTYRLLLTSDQFPEDVINEVLRKQFQTRPEYAYDAASYVLKVAGKEEYLLPDVKGNYRPLYQYTYVFRKIMKGQSPMLVVRKKSDIVKPKPRPRPGSKKPEGTAAPILPPRPGTRKLRRDPGHADLLSIREKFSLRVVRAAKVNCEEDSLVQLKVAIYHGIETICDIRETDEAVVKDNNAEFNADIEFDLDVCDLPRMSRLCISLYVNNKHSRNQKNKTIKELAPLAWVNVCVFDFKARLNVGEKILYMWPYDDTTMSGDGLTNHLGTVISNPHIESAVALQLEFSHFNNPNKPIIYPSIQALLDVAADELQEDGEYGTIGRFHLGEEEARQQLSELLEHRDPLQPLHEQEKEQMWAMRFDISTSFRNSLPRLLSCLRWNVHADVAQMQALLQTWPTIDADTAIELLDCMYPDQNVRQFAVRCLKQSISDSELCRYLLQLVQALKFESYLDCHLVNFLLERAIKNRKLGHYLFWLLKSEMHVPSVSVRFGLILEAYCNASAEHVAILVKQNDAVSKMLALNRLVKSEPDRPTAIEALKDILKGYKQTRALSHQPSPLNIGLVLSTLKVEKCTTMSSKMKPLWLVWENDDRFGEDIKLIFKNGDDLRQDMLTLQIFHIMDNIWLSQGLDLRMNAYECLPTGKDAGLLEVVQKAETISKIQKQYKKNNLRAAFNRESLFKWLQEKNPEPDALQKAINEFTLSCAGACVASYVLGIGDRHNDNIMLKETGQLFHIDFGHFLGNFKFKFGIKRERVPFVLTHDFMYVVSKNTRTARPHDDFKQLCENAYMLLRKKGNLLISLFVMMVSTGIPELKSVSDLKHLQETLKLDQSDEQALQHFRLKYKDALNNSWKTSINWAFHNYAHNST